jgi:3-mercaptopyruvate sulfurtransferase SseA
MPVQNSATRQKGPILMIGLGLIIIISTVVLVILNNQPKPPESAQTSIPYPEIQRISISVAKKAYDNGEAVFLDVREADLFASMHIHGSINIPLEILSANLPALDPNQAIITYCT